MKRLLRLILVSALLLGGGTYLASRARIERQGRVLIEAAARGDRPQVLSCLRAGVPVNARDPCGWTALSWAAAKGHKAIVIDLLERGG